jgi:hypothetical protein
VGQAVGGYRGIGAPKAPGELRKWLKRDKKQTGKQAKFMKNQPQNTEIENTQPAQLFAVGYSVFP